MLGKQIRAQIENGKNLINDTYIGSSWEVYKNS